MDAISRHRLGMLGLDAADLQGLPLPDRLAAIYRTFVSRVPFENLSNNRACRAAPDEPEAWPRCTDRFLREHRGHGFGGTSFTLAYALRDLLHGAGANAHCTLGHNLVTEEAHAAVLVFLPEGPVLYDPALLACGPVPVHPDGTLEDPLGTIRFRPRHGPTLTLCLRFHGTAHWRQVYSFVPMPAPPQSYRQAWVASFHRGRARPLRLACRVNDEIRRYGERGSTFEVIHCRGRERRGLGRAPVRELNVLFGIDAACLEDWFQGIPREP
jgi:arylamine N-acetyltransferase